MLELLMFFATHRFNTIICTLTASVYLRIASLSTKGTMCGVSLPAAPSLASTLGTVVLAHVSGDDIPINTCFVLSPYIAEPE